MSLSRRSDPRAHRGDGAKSYTQAHAKICGGVDVALPLTEEMLQYFKSHHVHLSTSLDGPEWLHHMNRPNREEDSFRRTIEGIQYAREVLGEDAVAALTTLTRESLNYPEAIIDTYVEQGFTRYFSGLSVPMALPWTEQAIGYPIENFLGFYERAH